MNARRLVAVVTARAGSKGLPGKNVALLGGEPLIAHSIRAGLDCPFVDRVVVTTDDPAAAAIARSMGAAVVDRPAALAGDAARSEDAVRHALDAMAAEGEVFDRLALLQPTSPLRTARHLAECVALFDQSQAACAVSVVEAAHPPQKSFVLDDGGHLSPLFGVEVLSRPRQLLPKAYYPNGAVYLMGCDDFRRLDCFFAPPALPYVMSAADSIDVDTADDLERARFHWASRR